jgi:hypothetical protein
MAFDSAICIFCGVRLSFEGRSHASTREVNLRERVCPACWSKTVGEAPPETDEMKPPTHRPVECRTYAAC